MYDIPKFALAFILNDTKRKIKKYHCEQLKIPNNLLYFLLKHPVECIEYIECFCWFYFV